MSKKLRPYPTLPSPEDRAVELAIIVAECSYLPNPETVKAFKGPVFPTVRARSKNKVYELNGDGSAMYDNNTTPRWALMWTHGYLSVNRTSGWMHAHVWSMADDVNSYTNLANLVMIPEWFGSLTDKNGPLTRFLQWHSWDMYKWHPQGKPVPLKPTHYEQIVWRYFDPVPAPRAFIKERFLTSNDQRLKPLEPLMKRMGVL